MAYNQRTKLPSIILLCIVFVLLYQLSSGFSETKNFTSRREKHSHSSSPPPKDTRKVDDILTLTAADCSVTFPGLTKEVDDAVAQGPFELPFKNGIVLQAKLESGQLYVLRAPGKGELSDTMRHRQLVTLHQLHRAIVTSPERLPDTAFAFAAHDIPVADSMSYARPVASPSRRRIWPMPHFAFWSWPLPFIDSIPSAARAIAAVEAGLPFHAKHPRAVWRGTTWFNNGAGSNPRLRQELVAATKGQPWADVEPLNWTTNSVDASNALKIEDFCRYKYIIQTEGIGYSGRLQFHQLCESVLLTPALEWMQHTTHFVRPIFSSTLLGVTSRKHPSKRVRERWPVESPPDQANAVFVAGDWSDLPATVRWLEDNPLVAAGLARRQKETFTRGGYMTSAAEVCYWRALLKGWSQVARPIGDGWKQTGVRFEEFVTVGELQQ
ncbi:O-glucosyltransferase-like protein [Paramyrothecium foliicola]|nr:O-glucosyltransferase-like protein [Paramyrothecium foliicola]